MESRIHIPSAPLSTFLWNSQAAVPFKKLPTVLNGPRWVGRRAVGRDWKLWSVTKSSTGDLFQSQREVRDHSLHLTFLYLPSHPPIKKTGKPKYLPLGLRPQADTKIREWSCYTGPQSCRCGWRYRYCLGHQAAHCRYFYKRGCPGAPGAPRLPSARERSQRGFPARNPARRTSPALSADSCPLSQLPAARPFPLTSQILRRNSKESPRRLASCLLPNLARKWRDRGRDAAWLALFTEGMDDRECGVAAHRKAGDREFGVDSIDRSGV